MGLFSFFGKTPFQKAMRRFIGGAALAEVLQPFREFRIESKADAEALVAALRHVPRVPQREPQSFPMSPLFQLLSLFQTVANAPLARFLRERGTPEVVRIFRASFPPQERDYDDLLFLLKILMMYQVPEAAQLVAQAATHPVTREHHLWSVVMQQFGGGHPLGRSVVAHLRDGLPEGKAGIAFLDLANQRAHEGDGDSHPFDTPKGLQRLEALLADPDPAHFTYAHSATAAIPFLRTPERQRLLDLAWQHPFAPARLEAYWAAAKLGDERGIAALTDATRDVRQGSRALRYLEELGRLDAAPPETRSDEYAALATMANWLAHPAEFGAPPDALRVYDTRELFWPPTNDRRRLWLIEYTYEPSAGRKQRHVGLGMTGSVTFALFGTTAAGMPPEDAYGLHCAWELQTNRDPRAPQERTAEAGRRILGM